MSKEWQALATMIANLTKQVADLTLENAFLKLEVAKARKWVGK